MSKKCRSGNPQKRAEFQREQRKSREVNHDKMYEEILGKYSDKWYKLSSDETANITFNLVSNLETRGYSDDSSYIANSICNWLVSSNPQMGLILPKSTGFSLLFIRGNHCLYTRFFRTEEEMIKCLTDAGCKTFEIMKGRKPYETIKIA